MDGYATVSHTRCPKTIGMCGLSYIKNDASLSLYSHHRIHECLTRRRDKYRYKLCAQELRLCITIQGPNTCQGKTASHADTEHTLMQRPCDVRKVNETRETAVNGFDIVNLVGNARWKVREPHSFCQYPYAR